MIATQEFEKVLQIKLCRYPEFIPAATVSSYLVDGLLIDSGPAHTAEELAEFLRDRKVKTVVNTHFHEDHVAANRFLQDRYGVEIFASALAVAKISKPAVLYPYQEEVWGYPIPSQVQPLGKVIRTENFTFEVIPTPGHDRDHVCLFESNQRWLFSGDLYIGKRPVVCRPLDDQWQILEDLKTVRELKPRVLFPAPGNVLFDPGETLDKVIAHLKSLGRQIEELHNTGLTIEAIRQKVFGEENPSAPRTQNQFSSEKMVKSFLRWKVET
ncbi:MAG: MBL fold metallo-hydrolase [Deltaproteobacteria bacterium]|nr:MBL fold metallo-hydrolase [Deltaproteobacteria bacterium]